MKYAPASTNSASQNPTPNVWLASPIPIETRRLSPPSRLGKAFAPKFSLAGLSVIFTLRPSGSELPRNQIIFRTSKSEERGGVQKKEEPPPQHGDRDCNWCLSVAYNSWAISYKRFVKHTKSHYKLNKRTNKRIWCVLHIDYVLILGGGTQVESAITGDTSSLIRMTSRSLAFGIGFLNASQIRMEPREVIIEKQMNAAA